MNNNSIILKLYGRPETVFTLHEISQLFPDITYESIRDRLYYFTKIGKLKRPHQGIYAKVDYNPLELVNKLYKPSYISLETVLAKGNVVFQYYETIFAVSYLTRTVTVNDTSMQYRQIKGDVLTNLDGIEHKDGYFIAGLERAFLDAVYIYKNYHFDNLGAIDWQKVESLKKIYNNKIFEKRVEEYCKDYKEDYGIK
jgi:hypothetical protein